MSLASWMRKAEVRLEKGPHAERAKRDAETLLLHLIQRDKAFLMAHSDERLSAEGTVRYYALVERRAVGEPIQYITGEQDFFGLAFHVDRNVLIPRPETEGLVERALQLAASFERPRLVDVGTGSGAIAVAMAAHLKDASLTAIDIAEAALTVARANAERNGVGARIRFVQGDLLAGIAETSCEFVLSNPPYVPETDRASLAVEVRDHEPQQALFAGDDGLSIYRRLVPQAHAVLVAGGWLLMEIGYGQAKAIRALLNDAGFTTIEFAPDLQGIERVAVARKKQGTGNRG
jgi:release factor glutamine methyltransferase